MAAFAAPTEAVLQAQLQAVRLGGKPIVHAMQVAFAPGRWCAIVGPNGAGKSTLVRALAGLLPAEGQVQLLGRPLSGWTARERARRLAWLGQGETAADDLRVWDVVMLGRLPFRPWLAPPAAADQEAVTLALQQTRVWSMRERRLGALSGGERQRVLLARLLAVQAPVMLMDEPLAHLDPPHQADWLALVRELVAAGRTVISVLHELSLALQADDMLILQDGRLRHHGPAGDADTHRVLQAVFDHRISIHPLGPHWVALPQTEITSHAN